MALDWIGGMLLPGKTAMEEEEGWEEGVLPVFLSDLVPPVGKVGVQVEVEEEREVVLLYRCCNRRLEMKRKMILDLLWKTMGMILVV